MTVEWAVNYGGAAPSPNECLQTYSSKKSYIFPSIHSDNPTIQPASAEGKIFAGCREKKKSFTFLNSLYYNFIVLSPEGSLREQNPYGVHLSILGFNKFAKKTYSDTLNNGAENDNF